MGEELDVEIIQQTQQSLGKFIKKPPLSEKLLRKPPFKFLHDIVTSVISATGFMQDVYTEEELSSENIKDRDSKIAFLQKAIDLVALTTGEALKIRPNKTVAGHEPDKTNEFLQALSKAVTIYKEGSNASTIINTKSPSKSSAKKSEKKDSSHHRKSSSKEKSQITNADESPKNSGKLKSSDKIKLDKMEKSDGKKSETNTAIKKPNEENSRKSERENSKKSDRENSKNSERVTSKKPERETTKKSEREITKKSERETTKKSERETTKKSEETTKTSERQTTKKPTRETIKSEHESNKNKKSERNVDGKRDREASKKPEKASVKKRVSSKDRDHSKENGDIPRSKTKEGSQSKAKNKVDSASAGKIKERRGSKVTSREAKMLVNNRKESFEKNQVPVSPEKSPKKKTEEIEEDLSALSQTDNNMGTEVVVLPLNELSNEDGSEVQDGQLVHQSRPLTSRLIATRPPTGRPLMTTPVTNVPYAKEITAGSDETEGKSSNQEITNQTSEEHVDGLGSEVVTRPTTSTIRRSSARPPTARPAAPRVRLVDSAPEEPQSQEPIKQVTNIILDGEATKDNDDEDGLTIEEPGFVTGREDLSNTDSTFEELNGKPHGSLVTQILETKRDLESGSLRPGTGFKRVELDKSLLSDSARRKEREVYSREMDKLKESVQTLTKSANPLGKLIDYLQEDVDGMFRELDMWSLERQKHELALQKEESKTDLELESLKNQLQEVEDSIEDQTSKISAVKANIIRNEEKIQKMVAAARI